MTGTLEPTNSDLAALDAQLAAIESQATHGRPRNTACVIDWREVIDTSNDAFIATDAAGSVIEWNVKAEQLFGWTADQAIGRPLSETIFPEDQAEPDGSGLKALLTASSAGKRHEMTAHKSDGSQLPVEASVSMMRCGASFVFNAFIHDISRRRQLQMQLTHAQKLESIGQLSAGIAHEINTPTQYVGDNTRFIQESMGDLFKVLDAYGRLADAIRAGAGVDGALAEVDLLVQEAELDYLTEEMTAAISQTLDGVSRVASIVRAMKEFSHPGAAAKTRTDLNAAIKNTVTVATNEWKYVATIDLDLDEQLPPVPVLPGDFNQVILNLLVNAAHAIKDAVGHGGEKGVIRVSTRRGAGVAEVRVEDTGTGIPNDAMTRIFDPFFTTKDVGIGTGQGLAISRSVIVDKHAGTLEASNRTDRAGACFVIKVPLSPEDSGGY